MVRPLILILGALSGCATEIPQKEQGPPVVHSLYEELVRRDPSKRLVDLRDAIPGIMIDIRYATDQNFMKQPVYNIARPLLRAPAARALYAVQRELGKQGLGIKVWDAYRPYRVTKQMWDLVRNPDFVADPAKGSRHNRGAAVDLTLVDLATGCELEMPTAYDEPRAPRFPRAREAGDTTSGTAARGYGAPRLRTLPHRMVALRFSRMGAIRTDGPFPGRCAVTGGRRHSRFSFVRTSAESPPGNPHSASSTALHP